MEKEIATHFGKYACLETSVDTGAWWDTVNSVTKSWTRLKQLSK